MINSSFVASDELETAAQQGKSVGHQPHRVGSFPSFRTESFEAFFSGRQTLGTKTSACNCLIHAPRCTLKVSMKMNACFTCYSTGNKRNLTQTIDLFVIEIFVPHINILINPCGSLALPWLSLWLSLSTPSFFFFSHFRPSKCIFFSNHHCIIKDCGWRSRVHVEKAADAMPRHVGAIE